MGSGYDALMADRQIEHDEALSEHALEMSMNAMVKQHACDLEVNEQQISLLKSQLEQPLLPPPQPTPSNSQGSSNCITPSTNNKTTHR